MLAKLIDLMSNTDRTVNWVKSEYPEEDVVFSSSATFLATSGDTPVGWSLRRVLQRRGVVVLTPNRVFFRADPFSPVFLLYLGLVAIVLYTFFNTRDWMTLILAVLLCLFLVQRLPSRKQIKLADVTRVEIRPIRGTVASGQLLTLVTGTTVANIGLVSLPDEVKELLLQDQD